MVTTEELLAQVEDRVGPIRGDVGIDPTFIDDFPTPLDLAIADKPAYGKPNHLIKVEAALLKAWYDKESTAISMASRWGKSETVVYFLAWLYAQYPELKIMIVSYNQKLSTKFTRNVKRVIERFSPNIMDPDKQTHEYFETKAGGFLLSTSPDGTASGYGAGIVIFDDLLKNPAEALSPTTQEKHREYFEGVASARLEPFCLNDDYETYYDPFIIGIGTLYSTMDLLNSFHEWFESICIPALNDKDESNWPERWTTKALHDKREHMSSSLWNAMYMATPVARGGNLFKEHWLIAETSYPHDWRKMGLFVDPAVSTKNGADNTAITLVKLLPDNRIYVERLWTHKKTVFGNIDFIASLYQTYKPNILRIEDVGFANALVEGLNKRGIPAVGWKPGQRDKNTRIISQLEAPLETSLLCFHPSVLEDKIFRDEYLRFPASPHDDTLDVLAIAVESMYEREKKVEMFLGVA
ncbi:MAG: hypothetical protein B655_1594 [Methanobacterium sp. Maddingley MBC34]|nr:MAG: hypothetical protein B655_1594 [Methanobacterium sp. Maddingley MBC34]